MRKSERKYSAISVSDENRRAVEARDILRVGWASVALNILLAAVKLIVGMAAGSIALIGDGIHSVSDLLTDFIVLVVARLGSRPADADHPWGHGKYETFGALLISIAIIVAGSEIGWKSGKSFAAGEVHFPGPLVMLVAALSVLLKEGIYRVTRNVGERTRSQVLLANAWHHRSDAFSSIIVFLGGAASIAGWGHADQAAGVAVGLMVVLIGLRFGWEAIGELMERSAGDEIEAELVGIIGRMEGVLGWHKIRTRRVGRELFIDLHIVVSREMTVLKADEVAHQVEEEIGRELDRPCNVMVHVDPDRRGGDDRLT